jgi:hypothetical protein
MSVKKNLNTRGNDTAGFNEVAYQTRHLDRMAGWLDNRFRIPGTPIRFGIDSLLGLIPGVGDVTTGAFSCFIIYQGYRLGVRKRTLLRMTKNVVLDTVIGSVPLIGDLFDIGWKANLRNVEHIKTDMSRRDSQ